MEILSSCRCAVSRAGLLTSPPPHPHLGQCASVRSDRQHQAHLRLRIRTPSAWDSWDGHSQAPQTGWLKGTDMSSLIVLESGSMKSKSWQNCTPSKLQQECPPSPLPALAALGSHGLPPASCLHTVYTGCQSH